MVKKMNKMENLEVKSVQRVHLFVFTLNNNYLSQ